MTTPQPLDLEAAIDQAIGHHQAGELERAEAAYRAILESDPHEPDALNLLGLILQNKGELSEALALLERALEIDPDFPEALTNMARAQRAAGNPERALACASRAVLLDDALAEAQHQLGRAAFDLGRDQEALNALEAATALDAGMADVQVCLGNVQMRLRHFAEAVTAYEAALAIQPAQIEALVNAGACLLKLDRTAQALAFQQRAVEAAPNDPVPYAAVASTLRQRGDIPGSVDYCMRALGLAPDYHDVLILLGTNHISLGQFDQAEARFREALAHAPQSGSARAGLAAIGCGDDDTAETDALAARFGDSAATDFERISAGFGLGAILDKQTRYDEAFAAYQAANDLVRETRAAAGQSFNLDLVKRHLTWARQVFTPALFAAAADWGNPSDRPVFVVGMARSGTTLVEQIAAGHPRVWGAGELKLIPTMISALDGGPSHLSPLQWDKDRVAALTAGHLGSLGEINADAARIIDKLPDNLQALGQIAVLFPNARIVLCHRDPRDVCLSSYFQYFGDGNDWSYDLAACGARARLIQELADHWRSVLPLPILDMQYEALVDDLEGQSRRLIAFLGLEWDPACLDFHTLERPVLTASHWQVRQPLYSTSVGRWRHYARHLRPLQDALGVSPDDSAATTGPAPAMQEHAYASFARALIESGAPERAIPVAHRAIAEAPSASEGHILLGVALAQAGRTREALEPLAEAARLLPDSVEARANYAAALSRCGENAQAEVVWREVLAMDPNRADALSSLGIVLLELKRPNDALAPLRQAAALNPDNLDIHRALALALMALQNATEAEAPARRAVELAPDNADLLTGLGEVLSALGEFEEGGRLFQRALDRDPGSVRAHFGLAGIGISLGADTDIPRLKQILSDPDEAEYRRIDAGFALARALQRAGDYEGAFQACSEANRLVHARSHKQGVGFNIESFRADVDKLILSSSVMSQSGAPGVGVASEAPVFIVGMPRSGTTLLEQIAASHPAVFGRGETKTIAEATAALNAQSEGAGRAHWFPSEIQAKAASILATMRQEAPDALRIIDKMPDNLFYLDRIALLFPKARIILCRRDLRDVGVSCFFESFTDGLDWAFDLGDIGARSYEMERLVVHWRNTLPLPMLEVQYEDVVADQERQSRRLIDFLGLPWDPACLDFHKTKRQIMTASHWQVRQPVYTSSVGRWKNYRQHLGPLIEGLKGLVPAD